MGVHWNLYFSSFRVNEDHVMDIGACIGLCPTNALSMEGLLALVEQSEVLILCVFPVAQLMLY